MASPTLKVAISDMRVSDNPNATLITHALGSCIGVFVHDPGLKIAGLLHYMLPLSKADPEKASLRPAMFADTGIPLLFSAMYEFGCKKENLVVKVCGGAALGSNAAQFKIGKRNFTVLRKMFWQNGVIIAAEDTGGSKSRTARIEVGSGRVVVRAEGQEYDLL